MKVLKSLLVVALLALVMTGCKGVNPTEDGVKMVGELLEAVKAKDMSKVATVVLNYVTKYQEANKEDRMKFFEAFDKATTEAAPEDQALLNSEELLNNEEVTAALQKFQDLATKTMQEVMGIEAPQDPVGDAVDNAKEKVGDAADAVKEAAGEVADKAAEKAGDAVDAVKEAAGDAVDATKDAVKEAVK